MTTLGGNLVERIAEMERAIADVHDWVGIGRNAAITHPGVHCGCDFCARVRAAQPPAPQSAAPEGER